MARKILIVGPDGKRPVLSEVPAANEDELQRLLRDTPDLIPTDELGIAGPLLVVGRETYLPSGAVDLVAIARSGELFIIELKTGPQNPDFRAALSQAVDYGADLWGMSLDEFESTVALTYFKGAHCQDPRVKGMASLGDAARAVWSDMNDEELALILDRLGQNLTSGSFFFIVAAQRFTPAMLRTIEYLNDRARGARFAAVELVAFAADGLQAFESRTAAKPSVHDRPSGGSTPGRSSTDENTFLDRIADASYRHTIGELFDFCRGLQLRLEWGAVGTSIRVPTPDLTEPLTVAWVFPPGQAGWMGLRHLTLGFDLKLLSLRPAVQQSAHTYMDAVSKISGGAEVTVKNLFGRQLQPTAVQSQLHIVKDAIAGFVRGVNEGPPSVTIAATEPADQA